MSSYVIPFVYKSVFSFLVVVALVRVLNKILFKILLVVQLLQFWCPCLYVSLFSTAIGEELVAFIFSSTIEKTFEVFFTKPCALYIFIIKYKWLHL